MYNQPKIAMIEADASIQELITEEQGQFFIRNGFLVIRNVVVGDELRLLQEQTLAVVQQGIAGAGSEDHLYRERKDGKRIYWRTEYIIDKCEANKALLGHPFILRSVERLQGRNFIPTWDSLVVKVPDNAAAVPWHRDAAVPEGCTDTRPIFNVDFYLDDADERSCLWVIPGSHHWGVEEARERCSYPDFDFSDAVPVPVHAGDVLLHNIQLLHGSPEGEGNTLRRTVYYEFRPGEIEAAYGPHTQDYYQLKQQVLLDCVERRKQTTYAESERPFEYRPEGDFAISKQVKPDTHRYPHERYWKI